MAREQLKELFNDWQANQIPSSWAGEALIKVEVHFNDGTIIIAVPGDWIVTSNGRYFKLTDAEHTAAFEPWVDDTL